MILYRRELRKLAFQFFLAGIIFLLGMNAELTERLYTNTLYPIISTPLRWISSLVPFALGDLFYILLIGYIIRSIYLFLRSSFRKNLEGRRKFLAPIQVLNFLLLLYILFKLLWGLNYSRPSVASALGIHHKKYSVKELVMLGRFLITRINQVQLERTERHQNTPQNYTAAELQLTAKEAYDQLGKTQPFFDYKIPVLKPVLNSWVITKIGLEGYYSPPTGEANINLLVPTSGLPFIACHEMAHQIGIAREDEANLIGYLVSTASKDLNFQYAGYYSILRNVMFEIRLKSPEDYKRLYQELNALTIADYKNERIFWKKYNNDMFDYFGAVFDKFLKINNQHKGTDSYQDIVLWVYNIHEKELKP